jgi:hypothetical protein
MHLRVNKCINRRRRKDDRALTNGIAPIALYYKNFDGL